MVKYFLILLVMFSATAFGTEYVCTVARQKFVQNDYHTKSYTKGIVRDDTKTISFEVYDNKDRYRSGILTRKLNNNYGIEKEYRRHSCYV